MMGEREREREKDCDSFVEQMRENAMGRKRGRGREGGRERKEPVCSPPMHILEPHG